MCSKVVSHNFFIFFCIICNLYPYFIILKTKNTEDGYLAGMVAGQVAAGRPRAAAGERGAVGRRPLPTRRVIRASVAPGKQNII